MVARSVKLCSILPQANGLLCYKVDATSVKLFSDFTITLIDVLGYRKFRSASMSNPPADVRTPHTYRHLYFDSRSSLSLSNAILFPGSNSKIRSKAPIASGIFPSS